MTVVGNWYSNGEGVLELYIDVGWLRELELGIEYKPPYGLGLVSIQ